MRNRVDIDPLIGAAANSFAPTRDGRRFLMAERAQDPNASPLKVVVNWPALLKPQPAETIAIRLFFRPMDV